MCKKLLVLAIGLLSGLSFTVNAEEPATKLDNNPPKLSLQRCAELFPNMEQKVQQEVREEKIERLALVIGNQAYEGNPEDPTDRRWARLGKTETDAAAMKTEFSQHDFHVLQKNNVEKKDLDRLVCKMGFILKHSPVKTAAFYYSGHGLQNVIVPKDMETTKANDPKAFSVDNIIEVMNDSHKQNPFVREGSIERNHIVLLDSCRNGGNGKGGKGVKPMAGRNGLVGDKEASGGVLTSNRPTNLIVSYAAAPDQSAYEDPNTPHSFYTHALLNHLFKPSISVKTALDEVRDSVYNDTHSFIVERQKDPQTAAEFKNSQPQQISNDDAVRDFYLAGQQELKPTITN
ncbi:MAG: hypothetical protein RIT27_1013 [Pseudomonadota bacterium]|jgi:uncharacterized caspase-like protein